MFSKYPELIKHTHYFTSVLNKQDKKKLNDCPECGNIHIIEDTTQGILLCKECGTVIDKITDYNPEWKQFDDSDNKNARCGLATNPLLPNTTMVTTIGCYYKNKMKMINDWQATTYKERSIACDFQKINDICVKANIPKCVIDDAKIFYKRVSECKHVCGKREGKNIITRGKNRICISASCVYIACVKNGTTYTTKEIAKMYGIEEHSEINKSSRYLRKMLKINKKDNVISKPTQFIKRFCVALKIKNCYIIDATRIASNIEKLNLASEHNPISLAAASIFMMADMKGMKYITKRKLERTFGITDVTINKTYKKISKYKDILINDEKTNEIAKKINETINNNIIPPEILEKMKQFGIIPEITNNNVDNKDDDIYDDIDDDDDIYDIDDIDDMDNLEEVDEYYLYDEENELDIINNIYNKIQIIRTKIHKNINKLLI